jgi:hypothetical protein
MIMLMPTLSKEPDMAVNRAHDRVPSGLEKAIRALVKPRLRQLGIEHLTIEPGEDHDGDPVIYVDMRHRLLEQPIDIKDVIALGREIRDLAWNHGEHRFVHVRHHYDERQDVADHV